MNHRPFLLRRRTRSFWFVLLALLAAAPSAAAADLIQARDANVRASMTAAPANTPADALRITVDTAAGPLALVLEPHTQLTASAKGLVPAVGSDALRVYQGNVVGDAESWVRLSQIDGAWLGAIKTHAELWLLDPARFHQDLATRTGIGASGTLVFTMADIDGLHLFDSHAVLPPSRARRASTNAASGTDFPVATATSAWHLGVSLVLDTEFQSQYGSLAADVALAILNVADGFYTDQVNTNLYLHHLRLLPSNGGMTSTNPDDLLDAFVAYLDSSGIPFSGVAHLLSGKDFDGNTAGLAYVGALCNKPYGSGVDEATFSAAASGAILAHEMGHNYGGSHDGDDNACPASGYILASILNLGVPATQFSTCSLDYFADYLSTHAHGCLVVVPDAIFADDFE